MAAHIIGDADRGRPEALKWVEGIGHDRLEKLYKGIDGRGGKA
jgi:hypothetical protein